jgi:hypothetical protein
MLGIGARIRDCLKEMQTSLNKIGWSPSASSPSIKSKLIAHGGRRKSAKPIAELLDHHRLKELAGQKQGGKNRKYFNVWG